MSCAFSYKSNGLNQVFLKVCLCCPQDVLRNSKYFIWMPRGSKRGIPVYFDVLMAVETRVSTSCRGAVGKIWETISVSQNILKNTGLGKTFMKVSFSKVLRKDSNTRRATSGSRFIHGWVIRKISSSALTGTWRQNRGGKASSLIRSAWAINKKQFGGFTLQWREAIKTRTVKPEGLMWKAKRSTWSWDIACLYCESNKFDFGTEILVRIV